MSGSCFKALDPEPGAQPPEPADHRVTDEQDPVALTQRGDALDVALAREQHPAGAHHRLAEEGRDALGPDPIELFLQRLDRVMRDLRHATDERAEAGAIHLDPTDRGTEPEHAVESLRASDHVRPLPLAEGREMQPRELRGRFDAVAAAGGQEHPRVVERRQTGEAIGEPVAGSLAWSPNVE